MKKRRDDRGEEEEIEEMKVKEKKTEEGCTGCRLFSHHVHVYVSEAASARRTVAGLIPRLTVHQNRPNNDRLILSAKRRRGHGG